MENHVKNIIHQTKLQIKFLPSMCGDRQISASDNLIFQVGIAKLRMKEDIITYARDLRYDQHVP